MIIITATIESGPDQPIASACDIKEAREVLASWLCYRTAKSIIVELHFWRQNGMTGSYELLFSEAPNA
jgi:hypothetical protein